MQDLINEARLLSYAYETLKTAEGWHQEMLDQFKKKVDEAEEKVIKAKEREIKYTIKQDYLIWLENKTDNNITEADLKAMNELKIRRYNERRKRD